MSEQPFRIISEPMSFQDRAFISIATTLVRTAKKDNRREVSCDIQAAWDLAKAMAEWRERMTKER